MTGEAVMCISCNGSRILVGWTLGVIIKPISIFNLIFSHGAYLCPYYLHNMVKGVMGIVDSLEREYEI